MADCSVRSVFARRAVDPRTSCFTLGELRQIAQSLGLPWSRSHTRARLKRAVADEVGDESEASWAARVEFLRRNPFVAILAFKPPAPRKWLNELDINHVMAQFASTRAGFEYHGTHPVDFQERLARGGSCVEPEWCGAAALDRIFGRGAAPEMGWIFNTDRHDQRGSHWIALYVCRNPRSRKYGSMFFNSVGSEPPELIRRFIRDIHDRSGDPRFAARYSPAQMQFGNSECGVFCISFLVSCVRARTLTQAMRDCAPNDEVARSLRKVFFRFFT